MNKRERIEQPKSWHEAGELPPAGIEVEVIHGSAKYSGITVGQYENCMVCALSGGGFYAYLPSDILPIKSERERVIELAAEYLEKKVSAPANKFNLGLLYDAGMLKLPE